MNGTEHQNPKRAYTHQALATGVGQPWDLEGKKKGSKRKPKERTGRKSE
jgi:hypothetical protein